MMLMELISILLMGGIVNECNALPMLSSGRMTSPPVPVKARMTPSRAFDRARRSATSGDMRCAKASIEDFYNSPAFTAINKEVERRLASGEPQESILEWAENQFLEAVPVKDLCETFGYQDDGSSSFSSTESEEYSQ
jgi:hypothetical protein